MSLIPKKGTVYVVDDDEAVRDSLQWLLEGKDYRVKYHPDGSVAQTLVYYYAGDARADDVPSGSAIRRQVTYDGKSTLS